MSGNTDLLTANPRESGIFTDNPRLKTYMKPDSSSSDSSNAETTDSPKKGERPLSSASQPMANPVETLQRRYSDQLSQEIEQLEEQKSRLQTEIATLQKDYAQLQQKTRELRAHSTESQYTESQSTLTGSTDTALSETNKGVVGTQESIDSIQPELTEQVPAFLSDRSRRSELSDDRSHSDEIAQVSQIQQLASVPTKQPTEPHTERIPPFIGPRLPGESPIVPAESPIAQRSEHSLTTPPALRDRPLELPTPATSEQRRQRVSVKKEETAVISVRRRSSKKGLILSAIATALIAGHYSLVGTLAQGGTWLGLAIGETGTGFLPAVALLWLRMLVMIPLLVILAPQLYPATWEDLQAWIYTREQLLIRLVGSGIALFLSQVLLYQSIGLAGPAVGAALLFLYPLTAIPLGLVLKQERPLTAFGLLALVALAMGGLLVARPLFAITPSALWLGLLASLALSLYIVLTNLSYRQQCHPIPTAVIQFSTVAVASSLVLLIRPLQLEEISWISFFVWGLVVGVLMLLAYLFNYSSLRSIGPRTAIVAAATPLVALLFTLGLEPAHSANGGALASLEIIQLTGIALVSIGGIALGKEKLSRPS
ncbi:MAG: hypothetical protein AAFY72_07185 [Cyanobacteria bacterium J06649_4]